MDCVFSTYLTTLFDTSDCIVGLKICGGWNLNGIPEKDITEMETKLTTAENNYDIERRKFTPISNIWYSSAGITISIAAFIASFLITTFLVPAYSDLSVLSFSNKLQFSLPISLGALTVPLMIYAAANNVKLQKQNSTLSAIYSEISGLRSRITSLQQKIFTEAQKKEEKKPWAQAIRDELTFAKSVLMKIVSEAGPEKVDKFIPKRIPEGFTCLVLRFVENIEYLLHSYHKQYSLIN